MRSSILLTDVLIRKLKPSPKRQYERFDAKITGLGVRVSPGGAKSFFLTYRMGRRNRRLTFGRYPIIALAQARQEARQALEKISKGIDPANAKKLARDDYETQLFPNVLDDFIENHARRKTRRWKETERILRREFEKPWRKLQIGQIAKQHVNEVLDKIVQRGAPSSANHGSAHIKKFFNWCVERGYLDQSPCAGVKKPCKVVSRDRVLSDYELAAIWIASEKRGWPSGPFLKLLILTGQRRSEVAGMRWAEIDLQKGLWELPPGSSDRIHKPERRQLVPLSAPARDTIQSLPCLNDELVFPARGKDTPVSGFSKCKHKIDELSGVRSWTLHDIRRTVATGMARLGVAPHVIELILDHKTGTLGGVAGIYNRFQYLEERRDALERWSRHIEGLLENAQKTSGTAYQAHENDTGLAHWLR